MEPPLVPVFPMNAQMRSLKDGAPADSRRARAVRADLVVGGGRPRLSLRRTFSVLRCTGMAESLAALALPLCAVTLLAAVGAWAEVIASS